MGQLSISLLGPCQVMLDGIEVTDFESGKAYALLAYLALKSEHTHRREVLAGLLWPDQPEAQARQNLRRVLYNLRKVIHDQQENFLSVSAQTIRFNPTSAHWLDTSAFSRLLNAVEAHKHRSLTACDPCLEKLEKAAALYRGSFMQDFIQADSQEMDEWVLLERERYRRRALMTLESFVDAYQRRNEVESLLKSSEQLVTLDPWNESGQRGIMCALALSGQRSAALAQYETCRQLLMEELGVEPEPATTELYERIQRGGTLVEEGSLPPHKLPVILTAYVERRKEQNRIKECLVDQNCRMCTLVGPGGSGKTLLAVKVAEDLKGHFEDGIFFVPFEPLDSPEGIVPTLATALGFTFFGQHEPREQLLNYLVNKSMLLIFDNFEHLLDGVDLVVDIINTAPDVVILTTSRVRLNVQAEHTIVISGMNYPEIDELPDSKEEQEKYDEYSAIKLLQGTARRVQNGFALNRDNMIDVVRICRLVNGMPLGIVLAASWLTMLSPREIVAEIEKGLDFLKTDMRDIPARHHSMRAVFDHSWSLLGEEEKRVFRSLTVFRGGFTREAADEIVGSSARSLKTLIDRSLLQRDRNCRFTIHRLLREYGTEKLEQFPAEHELIKDAHCEYYAVKTQEWGEDLKGSKQSDAYKKIEVNIRNAQTAWNWAVDKLKLTQISQALDGLCIYYRMRLDSASGEAICGLAANKIMEVVGFRKKTEGLIQEHNLLSMDAGVSEEILRILSRILTWQGCFSHRQGNMKYANELVMISLTLLNHPSLASKNTRKERAILLFCLGEMHEQIDRVKAREYYAQSLEQYRSLGDRWGMANALTEIGLMDNDIEHAVQMQEESISLRREIGDRWEMAVALMRLCLFLAILGRYEEGIAFGQEGMVIHRESGSRFGLALGLGEMGAALFQSGRFTEAREYMLQCIEMLSELRYQFALPQYYTGIGHQELHMGMYAQAVQTGETAIVFAQEQEDIRSIGNAQFLFGAVALVEGHYDNAKEYLEESQRNFKKVGDRKHRVTGSLVSLGLVYRKMGDSVAAKRYIYEGMRIGVGIAPLCYSLPGISLLLVDEDKVERALELYAHARCIPVVMNSQWIDDVDGQHIRAAAESLPSEVIAEAEERGRARDQESMIKELLVWLEIEITAEEDQVG